MYSLDINFLNDRPEYKPDKARTRTRAAAAPSDSRQPLIWGGLAAILLPLLAGGLLLFLRAQNSELEQRQQALDTQLNELKVKQQDVERIRAQTKQIKDETTALASVFNQVKPWSAVMQDFRERIPPGVQILGVKQIPLQPGQQPQPAPSPQAGSASPPPPVTRIEIKGIANSFNDVNDFLLVLQKSAFLNPKETRLVTSELQRDEAPLRLLQFQGSQASNIDPKNLPKTPRQVEFTIQTAFNDVPASDLLQELNRKNAVGLVSRIEALQRKGVIQK
jgi:type IV pilus assembly protein PilN